MKGTSLAISGIGLVTLSLVSLPVFAQPQSARYPTDEELEPLVAKLAQAIKYHETDKRGYLRDDRLTTVQPDLDAASNFQSKIKQYSTVSSQIQLLNGTWEGTYVCRQGLTSLRLVITAQSTNEIDAVFYFSAHPRNPSVPSGSFRMVGTYRVFNSSRAPNLLELKPTNWINRPGGYGTVGLSGNVFPGENRIVGEVTTSGCSGFDVTKID